MPLRSLFLITLLTSSLVAANYTFEVIHSDDTAPTTGGNFTETGIQSGTGDLRGVLNRIQGDTAGNNTYTITFGSVTTVTLADAPLPPINLVPSGHLSSGTLSTVTIGNSSSSVTIESSASSVRGGFFVANASSQQPVTLRNITITGAKAKGGNGGIGQAAGGGGMGAGGGLFIDWPAAGNVVLENVTFSGCSATGGDGGAFISELIELGGGGGGGLGGNGGQGGDNQGPTTFTCGAGGGGLFGNGGDSFIPAIGPNEGGGGGGGGLGHGGRGVLFTGGGGGGGACWGANGGDASFGGAATVSGNVNNGIGIVLTSPSPSLFIGGGGGGGGVDDPTVLYYAGAGGAAEAAEIGITGVVGGASAATASSSYPGGGGGGLSGEAVAGSNGINGGHGGAGGFGGLFGGGGGSGSNPAIGGLGAGVPGDGGIGGGGGGSATSGQALSIKGGAGGYGGGGGGGSACTVVTVNVGPGGDGGFGGGGGGAGGQQGGPLIANGGRGGFGGSGGGGATGGVAGYGAGGAGGTSTAGGTTYGGGSGGSGSNPNGGGGCGFGGAIFINTFDSGSPSTVSLSSYFSTSTSSNTTTSGVSGGTGASGGTSRGDDLFVATNPTLQTTLHLNPPPSEAMTISNSLADDADSHAGINLLIGSANSGTVILGGTNSYIKGTTTINSGGSLQINKVAAISGSTVGNVVNNGTYVINPVNVNEVYPPTGVLSGTGAVTVGLSSGGGTGIIRFEGDASNTYNGVTTIESGTLQLSNGSAFIGVPGDVTINGGTLHRSTIENQITASSNMTLSGGTFNMGGFAQTLSSLDFKSGTLSQGGATLSLSDNTTPLTMRGNTEISGTVNLTGTAGKKVTFDATNNGTATLSGTLDMGGNTTTFETANGTSTTDMEVSGVIENGALTKTGPGTLAFSGASANSYSGLTTVSAGTLVLNKTGPVAIPEDITLSNNATLSLSASGQIASISNVTLAGSSNFDLNGNSNSIRSLNGSSTLSTVSLGSGTLTIAPPLAAMYSGVISGSNGNLTISGSSTQELAGTADNTYTGLTTVSSGVLNLNSTKVMVPGNVLINGTGTLTLSQNAEQITTSSAMTLTGSGTFNMGGHQQTIKSLDFLSGTLSQGGATLTINNTGTALTMAGGTTIPGSLVLSGAAPTVSFTANGSAPATLSSTLSLPPGTTTFDIPDDGTISTEMFLNGNISGGSLTKTGAGVLSLSGTSDYNGDTTISAGTLQAGASSAFSTSSAFIINGGTVSLSTFPQTIKSLDFQSGTLSQGLGATLTLNSTGTALTMAGGTSIPGSLVLSGAAPTVSFTANGSAPATLNSTLSLPAGTTTFNIPEDATITAEMFLNGVISGGSLTKTGAGTLNFSGASSNTYTGLTTVSAGTLVLNKTNAIAVPGDVSITGGALTISQGSQITSSSNMSLSGGTFNMGGHQQTIKSLDFLSGTLSQGGATLTINNTGTALTMAGGTTIPGSLVLSGAAPTVTFTANGSAPANLNSTLSLPPGTTTFNIPDDGTISTEMFLNGNISGGSVTKTGAGTLAVSGTSSNYSGTTTVSEGTLQAGASSAFPTSSAFIINGGSVSLGTFPQIIKSLDFQSGTLSQGGATLTINSPDTALNITGGRTISGPVILSGDSPTVTLTPNGSYATLSSTLTLQLNTTTFNIPSDTLVLSGHVTGTGGLTKTGAGVLSLSGTSNYNGDTTISAGTLQAGASSAFSTSSPFIINGGTVSLSTFPQMIKSLDFQSGTLIQGAGATLSLSDNTTPLTMWGNTIIPGTVSLTGTAGKKITFDATNNGIATFTGTLDMGGNPTTFETANGTSTTDMEVSGVIANGNLTKTGGGTLAFSGPSPNTYTGLTTVSEGTLNLNKNGVLAVDGNVLITGGTLQLLQPNQITPSATLTLSQGGFFLMGTNPQELSSLDLQVGTLTQGTGGTLTLNSSDTALKMNGGTEINGAVTLTGSTKIVVEQTINTTAAFGSNSSLNLGGGTLTLDIENGSQPIALLFGGQISNGSLIKQGPGVLDLSGTSSNYSGTTTVSEGTIQAGASGAFSTSSAFIINGGTVSLSTFPQIIKSLDFQSGTLSQGGATLTINNTGTALTMAGGTTIPGALVFSGAAPIVTFTANGSAPATLSSTLSLPAGTTTFNIPDDGTISTEMFLNGNISGGSLTKTGAGTLAVSGTSSNYSGTTTVSEGTLQAGASGAFSTLSAFTINGGTVSLSTFPQIIKSLNFQSGTLSQGGATLSLNDNTTPLTMRGNTEISGTVNLTGTAGKKVTFDATNNGTATFSGMLDLGSTITEFSIGTGPLSPDMEVTGTITGGDITKSGNGILRFSGTNTYGDILINEGRLQAGSSLAISMTSAVSFADSPARLELNGYDIIIASLGGGGTTGGTVSLGANTLTLAGITTAPSAFAGGIIDTGHLLPGSVTKTGTSTQIFSGTNLNTYYGTTTISAGTLQAGADNAFSQNSPVSIGAATLDLGGFNNTIPLLNNTGGSNSIVQLGAGILTLNITLGSSDFSGSILGSGGITKTGSTKQALSGSELNTYGGQTTVREGKLEAGAINAFSPNSAVVLSDSATLDLNNYDNTVASLAGSGGTVSLGIGLITLSSSSGTTTFSGTITGAGGLTKQGSSKQVLSGTNTYQGPTAVNGGSLFVNESITSAVTVNDSGTFGGTGTVNGDVTVESGGTIAPGSSVGTMTINGNLLLESGSITEIEILPTSVDLLKVEGSGTATIDGELHLITFPEVYPATRTYTFLTAEGGLTLNGSTAESDLGGFTSVNTDFADLFDVIVKAHPLAPLPFIELTISFIPPQILAELSGNRKILSDFFNTDPTYTPFFNTIFTLNSLPIEEVRSLLDSISPARLAASTSAAINVGFGSIQNIVEREQQSRFLHFRKSKDSDTVVALKNDTLSGLVAQNTFPLPHGETRIAAGDDFSVAAYAKWSTQINHEKRQDQNPAFNTFSSEGNVGVEKFFANGLAGAVGNYANSWISQDTSSEVQVYGGSLYSVGYIDGAFIDLALSGYGTFFESNRSVVFAGLPALNTVCVDDKASSHHSGYQIVPHIGAGYDFGFTWGALEPYASIDWAYFNENDYTEKGASAYNMHIYKRHGSMLRSQIGLNAYQAFDKDWGVLFLKEELSYVNLHPFSIGDVRATIPGAPGDFTVFALTKNQSRAKASAELFFRTNKGSFFATQYGMEIGSRSFAQRVSATLGRYF